MQHHLHDIDLPVPNVYFATVESATQRQTHHLYVPAAFSGAAFRKVQNLCAMRHGFRPFRSNATVKMRRLKLQDYLEYPEALERALSVALDLGESDIVKGLEQRPQQIRDLADDLADEIMAREVREVADQLALSLPALIVEHQRQHRIAS
jgi:hypothetical protein